MRKYIKLFILITLFIAWARRSSSTVYLEIFRDGSCSMQYMGIDQHVKTFPFASPAYWRQVKWIWRKLLMNEKVEPDWERYREEIKAELSLRA